MRTIRDIVGVRPHPAVVRLDDAADPWILDAYHLTDDVRRHVEVLRTLLASPDQKGAGVFLIGHYGSGKSHFLAYVAQRVRGDFVPAPPRVTPLSLVNFRANARLEEVVAEAAGVETSDEDRRIAWSKLMSRHPNGILLLVDELSEFLRSKPDNPSFNEDVRFLQFLGEFGQSNRLFVVAAMQEQIEHTGDLEVALYRKIKDRYRIRLHLTPAHVGELVAESILVKKPAYEDAVAGVVRDVRAAFPGHTADDAMLARIYPLHPATLELLEEIRGRFSQARGVVDFTLTRLGGDPARGVRPFLDRPLGALLGPDAIVGHFRDLLETQPEFVALAERVLPYYDKHLAALFEPPAQRELAGRILSLLILVHLSPAREWLTAREAAYWLLFKGTRIAPEKNLRVVEDILGGLAERGRYVRHQDARWRLDLAREGDRGLETGIARELNELSGVGSAIFAEVTTVLSDDAFNPLRFPPETWFERPVVWHSHERSVHLFIGDEDPPTMDPPAIVVRLPWGPRTAAPGIDTLVPEPMAVGLDVRELLAMMRLNERPLSPDDRRRLDRRIAERAEILERQIAGAYRNATFVTRTGKEVATPPVKGLQAWVDDVGRLALRRAYPSFETYAPLYGPLPQDAHRRFMAFAASADPLTAASDEAVELVRAAYLVPLGLLVPVRAEYALPKRLDKHELVQLVTSMAESGAPPSAVYARLAEPVFGLVPDQIQALLGFLVVQGFIDILKGSRSYREHFETLTSPLKYDRVVVSGTLAADELHAVQNLATALNVKVPDQWTVFSLRRTAAAIRDKGQALRRALSTLTDEDHDLGDDLAWRLRWTVERLDQLLAGDDPLAALQALAGHAEARRRLPGELRALAELPDQVRQSSAQIRLLTHLSHHPKLPDVEGAKALRDLPPPPSFAEPEALEHWLDRATAARADLVASYRAAHDAFWAERKRDPALLETVDPIADSPHVGLQDLAEELRRQQREATDMVCRGLSDLTYEPLCRCGFDGRAAPIDRYLQRFAELKRKLAGSLERFFADDSVRDRLRPLREAPALDAETAGYLDGRAPRPGAADAALVDRCLSGLESTRELDLDELIELCVQRAWRPDELAGALGRYLEGLGASRLRFRRPADPRADDVAAWCVKVALRYGVPLPPGLGATAEVRPQWVTPEGLDGLDDLGLPERVIARVLGWILDGTTDLPAERPRAPSSRAACDVVSTEPVRDAEAFAGLWRALLRAHPQMVGVDRHRWLQHLAARAAVPVEAPRLEDVLAAELDAEWIVLDAWSAFIPDVLDDAPIAGPPSRSFALTPEATTTDRFNDLVIGLPRPHRFAKIDAIDRLIHERTLPIDDLVRIAKAEVHAALRHILAKRDPARPVLVFADHGFRLSKDGLRYEHGGSSTLERLVSVARFAA